jgi:diguanylate cyclase (GGDEF)-like protein
VIAALLAAAVWGTADITAGQRYSAEWLYLWNTFARLLVFLFVAALVSSLRGALAEQRKLASLDSLTGVANGRTFNLAAEEAFIGVKRLEYPFTLAYIDLDNFKSINDTLGHTEGDDVLQATAQALAANTRSTDVVARVGGDEFALLLPATDSEAAVELMRQLVSRTRGALESFAMAVSFSAGAATFLIPPSDTDRMVQVADDLMYEAKRSEKGSFRHVVVGADDVNAVADAPRYGKFRKAPYPAWADSLCQRLGEIDQAPRSDELDHDDALRPGDVAGDEPGHPAP